MENHSKLFVRSLRGRTKFPDKLNGRKLRHSLLGMRGACDMAWCDHGAKPPKMHAEKPRQMADGLS